jgi:hypothetical protein
MKYFKNYFNATSFSAGAPNDSAGLNFCGKTTMFLPPGSACEGAIRPEKQISLIARPTAASVGRAKDKARIEQLLQQADLDLAVSEFLFVLGDT